jgi:hypothetical protein
MKCLACGVEKDPAQKEMYPYDDLDREEPIAPLLELDCEGPSGFRVVLVCHACFHRLEPDQWISDKCWLKLDPITAYEQLPLLQSGTKEALS